MAKVESTATGLKPLYSFEQLVVGPNNQVAAAACRAVVEKPGETYNPLFIYGLPGVGKTHLMQSVAHEMLKANGRCKVKYISAERFISEILNSIAEDRVLETRGAYSQLDLLILDDVQYLIESKVAQEELFHIFNIMHENNRQVILAADRPPNQLTDLNKNIRSRLEWGLASDVKIPELPTRLEILRKKQASQGLSLSDDMLSIVAERLSSNVRELEGFLKRLHAYTTLSHQAVTLDLVKSVINEILPGAADGVDAGHHAPNGTNGTNGTNGVNGRAGPGAGKTEKMINPFDEVNLDPPTAKPAHGAFPPFQPAPSEPKASFEPDGLPPRPEHPPVPAPDQFAPRKPANPFSDLTFNPEPPPAPSPAIASTPSLDPRKGGPASSGMKVTLPDPEPVAEAETDEELPSGHKEVGAVFFFPVGGEQALETVYRKFQEVIKKHKLKFRLRRVHDAKYEIKGKINYSSFVDVCKNNKVPVAIVIGPPPETFIPEQDFYDLLTVTLDVQGVSLQLVNWAEINKDYRYLNLALDIALVRSR